MNSVFKNFLYSTGYQILAIIIPIATMPYLARVIGASGMGQYSYANSVAYYFVMFIMLGLNNYGNRTIASVRNDKKILSKKFTEIFLMQLFCGIIVMILYIEYCFGWKKTNELCWILAIYVFSAVIDINWLFFGLEKFRFTVTRNAIIKIISTASIFVFVKKESDLTIYVLIVVVSAMLSNLVLWPTAMKEVSFCRVNLHEIFRHVKPNLLLFIPIVAVSLYKYMDKIMLGGISSMEQVGYYEYSEKIIQIPIAIVNSLATVMLPRMSYLVANHENKEESKYITLSMILAMFISSSLCFGLMSVAKEFVPLFYGDNYFACVPLFYVLLPSCCFISFASVIRTQYLIPHKMDRIYISSVMLGAVVNVVINFILIPSFQALGAAFGTLVAEATVCCYQAFRIRNLINIKEHVFNILPFVLSGVIMFLILICIPVKNDTYLIRIVLKVLVGVVVYAVFCLLFMMKNKKEFEIIKKIDILKKR